MSRSRLGRLLLSGALLGGLAWLAVVRRWLRARRCRRASPTIGLRRATTHRPTPSRRTRRLTWHNTTHDAAPDLYFHLYLNAFANDRSSFVREAGDAVGRLAARCIRTAGATSPSRRSGSPAPSCSRSCSSSIPTTTTSTTAPWSACRSTTPVPAGRHGGGGHRLRRRSCRASSRAPGTPARSRSSRSGSRRSGSTRTALELPSVPSDHGVLRRLRRLRRHADRAARRCRGRDRRAARRARQRRRHQDAAFRRARTCTTSPGPSIRAFTSSTSDVDGTHVRLLLQPQSRHAGRPPSRRGDARRWRAIAHGSAHTRIRS